MNNQDKVTLSPESRIRLDNLLARARHYNHLYELCESKCGHYFEVDGLSCINEADRTLETYLRTGTGNVPPLKELRFKVYVCKYCGSLTDSDMGREYMRTRHKEIRSNMTDLVCILGFEKCKELYPKEFAEL